MTWPKRFPGQQREGHNGNVLPSGIDTVHTAGAGEIMEVLWSDYYGLSCSVKAGRSLASAQRMSARNRVDGTDFAPRGHFLLRGQVIRYTRSFFFVDRFELPSGTKLGLWHLVGFKLQLAPSMPLAPAEDLTVGRPARRASDCVTVS